MLVADDLTPGAGGRARPGAGARQCCSPRAARHAHSAILARARGIPRGRRRRSRGAGHSRRARPSPSTAAAASWSSTRPSEVRAEFRARVAAARAASAPGARPAAEPAVTRDGVTVAGRGQPRVGRRRAARRRRTARTSPGLVRTEFLFLGRQDAPDVEEQAAVYRKIAEALDGRRITLRTLDVGGDKPLAFLPTPAEANPFLGVRGIRLSLAQPDLLRDQLLAIVRMAQQTPVSVMFPMVTTVDELVEARRCWRRRSAAPAAVDRPGSQVGIMVEVPAAALKAAAFVPHVDFLSHRHQRPDPVRAGRRTRQRRGRVDRRPVRSRSAATDSGDLSGGRRPGVGLGVRRVRRRRAGRGLLLGMGVDALSVTPPAIPATKEAVRAVDIADAQRIVEEVLASDSAASVRSRLNRD